MKMKKSMQIMALLLVVFSVLSLTACKKYHMSEEEIKEACISEAEYFVGGYLRNDGPDFLEKYDPFPEQEYESKKLEDNYQPVEKVQRKLGFFACIRYNGSGGEKDAETRKNGSGCSGDRGDRQPGAKGAPAAEDR